LVEHGPKAKTKKGKQGIPAGRIRPSETAEEAARREFKEETGLRVLDLAPYPRNVYINLVEGSDPPRQFELTVFIAKGYEGKLRGGNNETKPMWVPISVLHKRRKLLSSVRQIVLDASEYI
jgi:8-oxo-dGTP pyrophosphatase MutT (NUDIX family)